MIGQIINHTNATVIQILHNSISPDELWISMYDCGFNDMIVCKIHPQNEYGLSINKNPISRYPHN